MGMGSKTGVQHTKGEGGGHGGKISGKFRAFYSCYRENTWAKKYCLLSPTNILQLCSTILFCLVTCDQKSKKILEFLFQCLVYGFSLGSSR